MRHFLLLALNLGYLFPSSEQTPGNESNKYIYLQLNFVFMGNSLYYFGDEN